MTQLLANQLIAVTERNTHYWQSNQEDHQRYLSPKKRSRSRGVVLSRQGWRKLEQAGVLCDEFGCRYTYDQLGERSHLDERTVSRLLSCEVKVDKNTLKTFFRAFNLPLEVEDYLFPRSNLNGGKSSMATTQSVAQSASKKQPAEVEKLVEELSYLKQRVRECEHQFQLLMDLNEGAVNQQQLRA